MDHVGAAAQGAVAAVAGALALIPTLIALVRIDGAWSRGTQWTLFILALAFAADTGAFFAGRHFWSHTARSPCRPRKLGRGVIGGMLAGAGDRGEVVSSGSEFYSPLSFLSLCLAAAGFSVVGDLSESLFKRHVHLKDWRATVSRSRRHVGPDRQALRRPRLSWPWGRYG